ncbi:NAD-dependent epimerase/dehydratase family protein, partial [Shigella sonnei]
MGPLCFFRSTETDRQTAISGNDSNLLIVFYVQIMP